VIIINREKLSDNNLGAEEQRKFIKVLKETVTTDDLGLVSLGIPARQDRWELEARIQIIKKTIAHPVIAK
jgi:hypothetical protein